jgi:radical SAM protein with 4Fe4S-binding SPASM domain
MLPVATRNWIQPLVDGFPLFLNIQIQTFEFCNLKCDFCPNHYLTWDRLKKKKQGIPYNKMSFEDYEKIMINLKKIKFNGGVFPYLMNEPLMDSNRMVKFIEITKKYLPDCWIKINTNGSNLTKKLLGDMIDAGLNELQIDNYIDDKYLAKIVSEIKSFAGENGKCYILINSNYIVKQVNNKLIDVEPHYSSDEYWNRGGLVNVNPDIKVPQENCWLPSKQMYIKWDGGALLCCSDWEYQVELGNVFTENIEDIWINEGYKHYRKTLKKGRRDLLKMCRKCNRKGDRIDK